MINDKSAPYKFMLFFDDQHTGTFRSKKSSDFVAYIRSYTDEEISYDDCVARCLQMP